jgi:GT2 family glycosyltransferase
MSAPREEPPEQTPPPPKVTAIVVSHNRAAMLRRCLDALERSQGRETVQAIVVDNGSSDGSAGLEAEYPNVQFIRLPKNFGLAKARNLGVRAASGEYILFLHEDTEVEPGAIAALAAQLDADTGSLAACPLLVQSNGEAAPQVGPLPAPGSPFPRFRPAGDGAIESVSGAAILIRAFFFQATRQIDERYGNYGVDAEICYQIRRTNRRIALVREARVVHHGGREWSAMMLADRSLGAAAFFSKHLGLAAGLKFRLGALARGLASPSQFWYLIQGQKCDGGQ